MTKQGRQIYFLVVIVISLVILAYTLLSATGYVINWSNWHLEQTGAISINSLPANAMITISGESSGTTPKLVRDLLPNNYDITVNLPDHITWQGLATVTAQQTTFFHDIVLFRSTPIQTIQLTYPQPTNLSVLHRKDLSPQTQYALSQLTLSADFKIIAKTDTSVIGFDPAFEKLYLVSTDNQTTTQTLATNVRQVDWNDATRQLLIVKPYEVELYQMDTATSWVLTRQSTSITEAIWFPTGHYIILASNTDISAIETRITSSPNQAVLFHGTAPHHLVMSEDGVTLYLTDADQIYALTIL